MSRIKRRLKTAEVAQGYPGFAYHNATTEDLTQRLDRFVLRPIKELPGQYQVIWYTSQSVTVAKINSRPRTIFGRIALALAKP